MKKSSKFMSLFLALVMALTTFVPSLLSAQELFADEAGIVVIAGSDFQAPGDKNAEAAASCANVAAILNAIKKDYPAADGLIFCGDYDKDLPSADVATSIAALKGTVSAAYPSMNGSKMFFVQGNHDQVTQGTKGLSGPGAHDTDEYGLYIIDEDDYQWDNHVNESVIKKTAEKLGAYLDAKVEAGYSKPVFVASHVPLHYSVRTQNGDAKYGKYLFDVLNKAGAAGLTVIFLYGHDHSQGWDNYLGGSSVYLAKGDSINIADPNGKGKTYEAYELNFTYMNAGFVGYYADFEPGTDAYKEDSGVDKTITMTVFEIKDGKVSVSRYDENGLHKLKSAGAANLAHPHRNNPETNTTVYTSPQIVKITAPVVEESQEESVEESAIESQTEPEDGDPETVDPSGEESQSEPEVISGTFTDEETGITVSGVLSGLEIEEIASTVSYRSLAKYQAYEFSVSGYTTGDEVEVSIPVPEGYEPSLVKVYYLNGQGGLEDQNAVVANGFATFTATHFSTYILGQGKTVDIDNWVKVEIPGETTYTYTLITNAGNLTNGSYLIAAQQSNNIMIHDFSRVNVTINRGVIVLTTNEYAWDFSKSGDNWLISFGNTYMRRRQTSLTTGDSDSNNRTWSLSYNSNESSDYPGSFRFRNANQYNDNYYYLVAGNPYSLSTSTNYKRLFKLTNTETTTAETYYLGMEYKGNTSFRTSYFADEAALKAYIQENLTVVRADDTNETNVSKVTNYTLTGSVDPTAAGSNKTYTVKVGNTTVGTVSLSFVAKQETGYSITDTEGIIYRAPKNANEKKTGAKLTVYFDDNSSELVDITTDMLSGTGLDITKIGVYENLTVTYNGRVLSRNFKLVVLPRPEENDYPEYPQGGSVRVTKTGEGIDFQNTGVAKIELTASGIPAPKGIDVIVMLDTSSSMTYGPWAGTETGTAGVNQRIDYLRNSLRAMLEKFSTPNEDGSAPDVRLAMADFNGYSSINRQNDRVKNGNNQNTQMVVSVYTGENWGKALLDTNINTSAFEQVGAYTDEDIETLVGRVEPHSGTNFDYAFDTVYRLAYAIQQQNAEDGVERELFVIFMSDGCPFQYNYYSGSSGTDEWNSWLSGKHVTITGSSNDVTATFGDELEYPSDITDIINSASVHSYFYNAATNNTHRMADAIKGSPDQTFEIISPDNTSFPGGTKVDGKDYMYTVSGLGATVYSIGFCLYDDHQVDDATITTVISRIASGSDHFFRVQGVDEDSNVQARLDHAFTQISQSIVEAATNAYFTDEMGENYDLQMSTFTSLKEGSESIAPAITVSSYPVYAKKDIGTTINGHKVTAGDVGKRYGNGTVLETVTFNENGTAAYSDQKEGNILIDGVIEAATFCYNTNATSVTLENGFELGSEMFWWDIGTIRNDEFVLSYYAYLTGSMEGTRPAGSYPTNESATLYYVNWLGNDAHLDTVSPVLPWKEANVSYAFYLVDENGNVVVNQSTGETGSFANKIAVTSPILEKILLNSGADYDAATLLADALLPAGYTLFDDKAGYEIKIASGDGNSSWTITTGDGMPATTVVTGYGNATDYTTEDYEGSTRDVTHTTVWFAVKYSVSCVPDVVVIDYGIPVEIDVLANDMFGNYGTLVYLSKLPEDGVPENGTTAPVGYGTSAEGSFGTAKIVDGKVTYQLNSMVMDDVETFVYVVKYNNPDNANLNGYYYDTVTVIPATTIYFEDDFIDFEEGWSDAGTALDEIQGQDRPGIYSLPNVDANNIYGYDPANGTCSTFSLGSSKWITVSESNPIGPKASFTFTGTGFDVISLTSKDTGFVKVEVYQGDTATGTPIYTWAVDTFYGYDSVSTDGFIKYVWTIGEEGVWHVIAQSKTTSDDELEEGEIDATENGLPASPVKGQSYVIFETNYIWKVTTDSENALYQIPIIKSYNTLKYGTYTIVLTPCYSSFFEHVDGSTSYDIYLDAIRVYAPAEGNTTAENAYKQDKEAYPEYIEIRENLIKQDSFGQPGAVFIDAFGKSGTVSQFTSFGPNNEVYLMPGQAIAFKLKAQDASKLASVHLGAKALNGTTTFTVLCGEKSAERTLTTATDMYYDITELLSWTGNESDIIIITNTTGKILSLTTIKITYTSQPTAPAKLFSNAMIGGAAAKAVFASYVSAHTAAPAPVEDETPMDVPTPVMEDVEEVEEEPVVIVPEELPEEIAPVEELPEAEPVITQPEEIAPVVETEEVIEIDPTLTEEEVVIELPELEEQTETTTELIEEPIIEEVIVPGVKKSGFEALLGRVANFVKTVVKAIGRLFGIQ